MSFLTHLLLSLLANGLGLLCVMAMKSAPPRLVLYVCLVSMLAILMPWAGIASAVHAGLPIQSQQFALGFAQIEASIAFAPGLTSGPISQFGSGFLVGAWLLVGVGWLSVTVARSARMRRQWQQTAVPANALRRYAHRAFDRPLSWVRVYRLPKSSLVVTTGVLRPEIWIGDEVYREAHLQTALNHELCHVAAGDQFTRSVLVVIERMLWWNPLVWWLGRRARQQMEYACDARCQRYMPTYRRTLAELMLRRSTQKHHAFDIPLGGGSDVIHRLEKLTMTYRIKAKHVFTLSAASALVAAASYATADRAAENSQTLVECHRLLPKGIHYDFKIASNIDTREGRAGEISVTLLDAANPSATDLPPGSEAFVQCVGNIIGIDENEDYPKF